MAGQEYRLNVTITVVMPVGLDQYQVIMGGLPETPDNLLICADVLRQAADGLVERGIRLGFETEAEIHPLKDETTEEEKKA